MTNRLLMTFTAAILATSATAQDAAKGEREFRACKACHSLEADDHGVGPSLHGLFGATSGQAEGFDYSDAMAAANIVWDETTLSGFLDSPRDYVEGTSMQFRGVRTEAKIADLVAYLAEATAAE